MCFEPDNKITKANSVNVLCILAIVESSGNCLRHTIKKDTKASTGQKEETAELMVEKEKEKLDSFLFSLIVRLQVSNLGVEIVFDNNR